MESGRSICRATETSLWEPSINSFQRNQLAVEKRLKRGALTLRSRCARVAAERTVKTGFPQKSELRSRSEIIGVLNRRSP
jgi:hypothetical protein